MEDLSWSQLILAAGSALCNPLLRWENACFLAQRRALLLWHPRGNAVGALTLLLLPLTCHRFISFHWAFYAHSINNQLLVEFVFCPEGSLLVQAEVLAAMLSGDDRCCWCLQWVSSSDGLSQD